MCGIAGIFSYKDLFPIDANKFSLSTDLMRERGPDAFGNWGISNRIELAHRRLSIIDLNSSSNQPFKSNCGNYIIIFNGEIYNYLEIKEELVDLGVQFRTSSDTEVLLNSFIKWGENCVSRFNGDWAFAIYNIRENSLFCSRDRFGVKPFNYSIYNNQFVFASSIKTIISYFPQLKVPNYNVISNFCRFSIGAQIKDTWFQEIKRLMPAHNIYITNGNVKIYRYWNYPTRCTTNLNFEDAKNKYLGLFTNAVKLRMRSDVPVGTTLSGGLDSSSIVSILRTFYNETHNTFTAAFDPKEFTLKDKISFASDIEIDESKTVKRLATNLNLTTHLIDISNNDFCNRLSTVIYFLEAGNSSSAIIPLKSIMNSSKKYVSVMLEGQGADELLGGYFRNVFPILLIELLKRGKIHQALNEFIEFRKTYSLRDSVKSIIRSLNINFWERIYYIIDGRHKVFGSKLNNYKRIKDYPFDIRDFDSLLNKHLYRAHSGVLVDLLHYGDAISLSTSIESRLPFMDVNLVEFSFQLPYNYKVRNGYGKYIHREAMKNIVPSYILEEHLKFGFNTPLSQHFSSKDSEAIAILLSETCLNRGIYNSEELKKRIDLQIAGKKNYSSFLFRLLSTEIWFRRFIDNTIEEIKDDVMIPNVTI